MIYLFTLLLLYINGRILHELLKDLKRVKLRYAIKITNGHWLNFIRKQSINDKEH